MNRVLILIGIAFANAARGIRQASTTSLLAVLTISVVLVLIGSAWLLVANMASLLDEFGGELKLTAYLDGDLSEDRHRPLMLAYEAWGGERRGRYSDFILTMAERGIAALGESTS